MSKLIDLTGQKFEYLTVLKRNENHKTKNKNKAIWLCKCKCGNFVSVESYDLRKGFVKSCGCYKKEHPARFKHGHTHTRLHSIWLGIIKRCTYKNNKIYKYYGGRGIKIDPTWESDFLKFYSWAMNNGYQENLSIDRIDNEKGYSPDNCRWVTKIEQANNKRSNLLVSYNGRTQTISQWAKEKNIDYFKLRSRIYKLHWDVERALTTP